jgi:hypothetical protein
MPRLGPPPADPLAAQEPFWQPIGRLVFAFGHLESQIDWCITALLDGDPARGEPSVASQIRNICSRIALVEALFRQRTSDAKRRDELRGVIRELGAIIKFRNGVLHGPWGAYLEPSRAWQKPRAHPIDLTRGSFDVTVEAIEGHVRRAAEVGGALVHLVHAIADEPIAVGKRAGEEATAKVGTRASVDP